MKAVAIILAVLAFVACLVVGIQAGSKALPDHIAPETPAPVQVVTPQQRTLLVIAVDDLQAETPRLVAVWVLFYKPEVPRLMGIVLYPNPVDLGSNQPNLLNAFSLGSGGEPGPDFLAAIQAYQFKWSAYLVIEKAGLAQFVDWLGGADLNGAHLDGFNAVAGLIDPWDDPLSALASQRALALSVCGQIAQSPAGVSWQELGNLLFPTNAITDMPIPQLVEDWQILAVPGQFSCDFPE